MQFVQFNEVPRPHHYSIFKGEDIVCPQCWKGLPHPHLRKALLCTKGQQLSWCICEKYVIRSENFKGKISTSIYLKIYHSAPSLPLTTRHDGVLEKLGHGYSDIGHPVPRQLEKAGETLPGKQLV